MANTQDLLTFAQSINITPRFANFRRSISNGGYVRQDFDGPAFYELSINLRQMHYDDYRRCHDALLEHFHFGASTGATIQFPSSNEALARHVRSNGDWNDSDYLQVSDTDFMGRTQSTIGDTIVLEGTAADVSVGDYVQFATGTATTARILKVYQIRSVQTSNTYPNRIQVTLNSPLVRRADGNQILYHGHHCMFNLILNSEVQISTVPSSESDNIWSFSELNFREIYTGSIVT